MFTQLCEMNWMIYKCISGVFQGSEKKVTNGYTDPQVTLSGERRSHCITTCTGNLTSATVDVKHCSALFWLCYLTMPPLSRITKCR
jgi:hypothetical protein